MKITQQKILGRTLTVFEGTAAEMQDRIDRRFGWIRYWAHWHWEFIPAPDVERECYSEGVWIYDHVAGRWLKP